MRMASVYKHRWRWCAMLGLPLLLLWSLSGGSRRSEIDEAATSDGDGADYHYRLHPFHDPFETMVRKVNNESKLMEEEEEEEDAGIYDSILPPLSPADSDLLAVTVKNKMARKKTLQAFKSLLTPDEKSVLMTLAAKLAETCRLGDITYFMYGGTLLGSYRHHDIIPWDDDFDVMADHTKREQLYSALKSLAPDFLVISAGPRFKFFSAHTKRTSKYPWNWPYIDVQFYMENDTHIWDSSKEFHSFAYLKSIMFPPHPRPLGGLFLSSPRDGFAALKATYKGVNCETYYYNHKQEVIHKRRTVQIRCEKLKNQIPFVHRSPSKYGMRETLIQGDSVIHSLVVDEPSYAVSKTYVLELA